MQSVCQSTREITADRQLAIHPCQDMFSIYNTHIQTHNNPVKIAISANQVTDKCGGRGGVDVDFVVETWEGEGADVRPLKRFSLAIHRQPCSSSFFFLLIPNSVQSSPDRLLRTKVWCLNVWYDEGMGVAAGCRRHTRLSRQVDQLIRTALVNDSTQSAVLTGGIVLEASGTGELSVS